MRADAVQIQRERGVKTERRSKAPLNFTSKLRATRPGIRGAQRGRFRIDDEQRDQIHDPGRAYKSRATFTAVDHRDHRSSEGRRRSRARA
jgi:hypothetical protein